MKLRLRMRIFALVSAILIVSLAITGYLGYASQTSRLQITFGEEAESLARTTAIAISDHMKIVGRASDMSKSRKSLETIQKTLWNVKTVNQLKADIKVYLTAWSTPEADSAPYLISTPDGELNIKGDTMKEHITRAFQNGVSGYLPLISKRNETSVTGYAAIVDTVSKSVTGIVEIMIDTTSELALKKEQELKRVLLTITWATLGSLVLVYLFASTITKPLQHLSESMRQVSLGNLDQSAHVLTTRSDEIGSLAQSFEKMMVDIKERDRMRVALHRYHGKAVTEAILDMKSTNTSGTKKDVAVMFTDIRSFTRLSEGLPAEDVVTMLNEYFSAVVHAIYKSDGVVDKFLGDGVMGIWGAPKSNAHDPHKAVQAALQIRKSIVRLNNTRKQRGQEPIYVGIGLHYGPAVAGNIGSAQKLEYTVIGDSINTAARIQSATKVYGQDLVISETVAKAVKNQFVVEELGSVAIEDKKAPLKLYRVLGTINETGKQEIISTPYSTYAMQSDSKIQAQIQFFAPK